MTRHKLESLFSSMLALGLTLSACGRDHDKDKDHQPDPKHSGDSEVATEAPAIQGSQYTFQFAQIDCGDVTKPVSAKTVEASQRIITFETMAASLPNKDQSLLKLVISPADDKATKCPYSALFSVSQDFAKMTLKQSGIATEAKGCQDIVKPIDKALRAKPITLTYDKPSIRWVAPVLTEDFNLVGTAGQCQDGESLRVVFAPAGAR